MQAPSIEFFIDLHCHPTYKPVGASYKQDGKQSSNPTAASSMWHYDPPHLLDKALNNLLGLTKFSQTNFTASSYGQLLVITVALGCIEKWFFNNKLGTGLSADWIEDFLVEIGGKRIDAIQGMNDYFMDLKAEIEFLEKMNGQVVTIDGKKFAYRLVKNFAELNEVMLLNEEAMRNAEAGDRKALLTIAVIPSIEGMHVLNCGLVYNKEDGPEEPANIEEILANAQVLKSMKYRPFFVTFSHHFYNQLCGHSKSLNSTVAKVCDQERGFRYGFTDTGRKVLDILLNNQNNDRILIDIKHLSPEGRIEYLKIREYKYRDVPVIVSHGACNGLPTYGRNVSDYPKLGNDFFQEEINFYDDEILLIEKTGGIFGLQLDERRVASKEKLKHTRHSIFRNKIMHYRSELLWFQIQYVAELLDANDRYSWGTLAIGSDYDGIVDPINSFWTVEDYPALKAYLERHAYNYLKDANNLKQPRNRDISSDEVVHNIFQNNAWEFFKRWY
ncbi:Zn-dependent dipeptidase, dipeptidase homolog [Filimonas lacunae]|uniref:Zn-dependent dipeptidase, dipeptidase homolog n=1 Tax=Filimonas lacunae TaxID=477680 RepID=A0A173MHJ5_9BACT|nr:membrane dipeptidase [Filimonas lacunae]BAV06966.1 hypothetical protein FLA_2986 [Filimonas lacunae]SIS97120.1 Zn-dependent dipeptidase, dipeptidase homolog [Filimonas lacunae]